jgi:hypothetical protein
MRFQPASFRPAFGRVLTIIVAGIAALSLAGFFLAGDVLGALRYGWWAVLLAVLAVVLFWIPRVDVFEHAVIVRNPLNTWRIPWQAIQIVDTKYALTLTTPAGRIEAWAAPASGRFTVFTLNPEDTRVSESARIAGSIRPGDTLSSESGAAANHIRRHWEELRDDGLLDGPLEPGALGRTWHPVTITVLGVLGTLGVLGLVL